MYLSSLYIENNGSIEHLSVDFGLTADGNPKPILLVGGNGSGKTNFLSLVTDALFETASTAYQNVLPTSGNVRSFFRIIGGRTVRAGASSSVALLTFSDGSQSFYYHEKMGAIDIESLRARCPEKFHSQLNWSGDDPSKGMVISDKEAELIFENGVYCHFPASRSESPYWLNSEASLETDFSLRMKFAKKLNRPIYVDKALTNFTQWLLGLIADSRTELAPPELPNGPWRFNGDPSLALAAAPSLHVCNSILRLILDDPDVRFVWLGRHTPQKVGIAKGNELFLSDLMTLSAGQSILLGLFGTLLMYADATKESAILDTNNVTGICVVDEIDSHIHIDLQYRVIPKLMKIFPKIQFICSTHSPVFILGVENEFGSEACQIIRLPDGVPVTAESFSEFHEALAVLRATKTFDDLLLSKVREESKAIVFVEGETDKPYLETAATALGRTDVLEEVEFEWIGAIDDRGHAFNTGKDALKHAASMFKANPSLTNRKLIFLSDNDVNTVPYDNPPLYIRSMPSNDENTKIKFGIENLLPEKSITEDFYSERVKDKGNGEVVTIKYLDKKKLCESICSDANPDVFEKFAEVINMIGDIVKTK